jgi:peptidyl-prolyl cis-trans isomerase D
MLQQMRQYTKTWFSWIFVVPLVISFAAWGINDVFRTSVPDTVAKVGDSTLSKEDFDRQYRLELRRLSIELRQPVTPEMARSMNVGNELLDSLVNQMALANVARNLGLAVSDAEISQQIRSDRDFAGPLGTFDHDKFERDIQALGMNEQMFLDQARRLLAIQQLTAPMQAAFDVPGGYARALYASNREERAVDYVLVPAASLAPISPPSDAVLSAYVKARAAQFSTPEYRDVSIAFIRPDDVANQVSVTPDQIKQQYDANASTYVIPEKRNLEQLIFNSQADAQAAKEKIAGGKGFEEVAASLGKKPADISLGEVTQQDLPDARGPAAFALPANGVSDPVKGQFGWVLLHVTTITAGKTTTLEQATPEIRRSLLAQLESAKIADIMNACQDALGTGAEIQEAAQRAGMHFVHVATIDKSGLGSDGKPSGAPDNQDLRSQIFKAEVGDIGDPFQSKDGSAFAIKVNGVTPPKLKPLDEVRSAATAQWTSEQQDARLAVKAQSLAVRAGQSQDLSAIARDVGGKVETGPALTRTTESDTFSRQLVQAIFNAKFGGAVSGPAGKGHAFVVARVTGIRHTQPTPDSREFAMTRNALQAQVGQDLTLSLAQAAKEKQKVSIHQDLVQGVVGGENS